MTYRDARHLKKFNCRCIQGTCMYKDQLINISIIHKYHPPFHPLPPLHSSNPSNQPNPPQCHPPLFPLTSPLSFLLKASARICLASYSLSFSITNISNTDFTQIYKKIDSETNMTDYICIFLCFLPHGRLVTGFFPLLLPLPFGGYGSF